VSNDAYAIRPPAAAEVPLLVSIPHTGTLVPREIRARFADRNVGSLPDTDWHLHVLWDFAAGLGATTIHARLSRFVVDLNRPRDRAKLYPGRYETSVVPTATFAGEPVYRTGEEPDEAEVEARLLRCWDPYHARIARELERIRGRFGWALLLDAHSIVSRVPNFAAGELPGLMLGDVDGTAAAPAVTAAVLDVHRRSGISFRPNDPFKGGYITRRYGAPGSRVHALQLEMSQRLYMDEGRPYRYRPERAERLRPVLEETLRAFVSAGEAFESRR
jgi:N-formylglutamate deformylase